MPIINGQVVRARFRKLKLDELSSVDRPAAIGAKAVIMKRDVSKGGNDMSADLMDRAATIAKMDNCSMTAAMRQARLELPAAFEAVQKADIDRPHQQDQGAPDGGQLAVAKARRDFDAVVREVAERDRVPAHVAMQRARHEDPQAFAAAYG
jgi:hypothetical protein